MHLSQLHFLQPWPVQHRTVLPGQGGSRHDGGSPLTRVRSSAALPTSLPHQVHHLQQGEEDAHETGHHQEHGEHSLFCGPEVRENIHPLRIYTDIYIHCVYHTTNNKLSVTSYSRSKRRKDKNKKTITTAYLAMKQSTTLGHGSSEHLTTRGKKGSS